MFSVFILLRYYFFIIIIIIIIISYNLYTITRISSHPLLMVNVEVYNSQRVWVTPFANGRCQSLLQSTRMGSHPLLMVVVKSLLQSTSMGSHPLLMVDVKVYYSQQEWVNTLC